MTSQALTSPAEAVRVPRAAGAVRFTARRVTASC
jgi:hypothetical protein